MVVLSFVAACSGTEDVENNDEPTDTGVMEDAGETDDDAGPDDTGETVEDTGPDDTGETVEDTGPDDTGETVEDTGPDDTGETVEDTGPDDDAGSECPSGESECEGVCTDTETDPDHCGECGEPCPVPDNGNAVCENSNCDIECDPDYDACGDQCVDHETNPDYCGDCETECDSGEECVDGTCEEPGVSFSDDVVPIFGNCTGCHGTEGDLDLANDPYENLVDVESADCPGNTRVIPDDADDSYLVRKLEGGPDICGQQMPRTGSVTNDEIQTIRDWIDEGALDN